MQTILGSGGAIGTELAKALPEYTDKIRLVSRKPVKVNETDELWPADLLDPTVLFEAVEGSEIVYVTVGFPYEAKFWAKNWPPFMKNVIEACKKFDCKLVFFDNVYMYDPEHMAKMTEETPIRPVSKKGRVRADLQRMIMDEVESGALQALIARCADYYGPSVKGTSILTETVFKPLSEGKKANWMGSDKYKHSYTYTPDAGKATALLGNTEDAFGGIWHLPTAKNPPTGREWVHKIADAMDVQPKYRTVPKYMLRLLGFFVPFMKEMHEMAYQYDRDYIFRSDKFEKRFDMSPTSYEDGIKVIIETDYQ